jgi:hypothetical protein
MGSGRWDEDTYKSSRTDRASKGIDDFHYDKTSKASGIREVHPSLDPKRINKKPLGVLESRDSTEHPQSNAVVVWLDVTGSNIDRAREAQKALPALMALLERYLPDPQVAIWGNDDILACGPELTFQASEFESDNRVDEHLRNLYLVGQGGGGKVESYDIGFYCAARKVALDCLEKRGKKGYLFVYADEKIPKYAKPSQIMEVFGDHVQANIPIEKLIEEAREKFNVWVIWPVGGYAESKERSTELMGEEWVLTLQDPALICELIGATVAAWEGKVSEADILPALKSVGVKGDAATAISTALAPVYASRNITHVEAGSPLAPTSARGATKL